MEEGGLVAGKSTAVECGGWIVFEDEAGQSMTPPRARTWGRLGHTPVARVRGRGSGRVSIAGMTCYRPGEPPRMFYAVREYNGRRDQPEGFGWRDFRGLLFRARTQFEGPIVLVWDNVRIHLTAPLREFIAANADWLTVFQLPPHAPILNPQEGIWSLVKRDIGNLAAVLVQTTRAVQHRLNQIQYRPGLVDSCLTGTGLTMVADPGHPFRVQHPRQAVGSLLGGSTAGHVLRFHASTVAAAQALTRSVNSSAGNVPSTATSSIVTEKRGGGASRCGSAAWQATGEGMPVTRWELPRRARPTSGFTSLRPPWR